MSVVAKPIKVTAPLTGNIQVAGINRARVALVIRAVDGNVFVGGSTLSNTTYNGMRILQYERQQVDGSAAEAAIYAVSGSATAVEIEGIEYIVEP